MTGGDSTAAALAATACLVAAAFCLLTVDRWLRRRASHDLAWSIAMALFVVGAAAMWWAESRGWSTTTFRLFFLTGAVLNVPWLGLGTVYLLFGSRIGHAARTVLVVLSGYAVGIITTSPMHGAVDPSELPTAKEHFGAVPRVLAGVGSLRACSMTASSSR